MAGNQVLQERAAALLEMHQPGNPVVLPTVWDAWSAKLAVDAGFAALTVGSHPVADSIGKPDNEGMTFDDLLARVMQITAAVHVPVSVDIESGYGEAPANAGADSLYPVGRHEPETLRRLTSELPLPVNAIALPDQSDPASYGPLGVGRISFGPFLQMAPSGRAHQILARWA